MRILAMILAGGRGSRLSVLANKRAKPAVPFAGKYRIIDFPLSNCVNSGIYTVGVVTQYRPRSLQDHIRNGAPWDLDRLNGGVWMLQPYQGRLDSDWYEGTADAIYQNLDFVRNARADYVLILSGDHVYKMDYSILISFHQEKRADVTVATLKVTPEEASRFGIVQTDANYRVIHFEEKPKQPKGTLASMGIYVFNYDTLVKVLHEDAKNPNSTRDFGKDIFPKMVTENYRVFAFPYADYWVDVGTIQSYWEAHMDLLADTPPIDLLDREWVIHTRSEERPPVNIRTGATVNHSLITDGCVVEGSVEYSVLSPGVRVKRGAVVRYSIVMTDAVIEPGAMVDRCIIDKNVVVGRGACVGYGSDYTENTELRLNTGISVVGKNTIIPPEFRIGRNVVIGSDLNDDAFNGDFLPSGQNFLVEATD
ncbi:MAG: glucose-1-phosphate adenylyltransferase [Thermoflexales bacterium]|nr:glucose-1-phosphate adenylyltransferase [Thermoflexales bacterium]MDW8351170.1 glucose-1-phosphate adenylyltransferase [Anaerolineae bacterium]